MLSDDQTHLLLRSNPLSFPQLPLACRLLLSEVRMLFHLGLVEAIHDRILALLHIQPLDQLIVLEPYLTSRHGTTLLQIAPWCVDDRDVVLLISLNAVGLGELRTVDQEVRRNAVPLLALPETHIDVGTAQVVDMKPNVFFPAVRDEFLISITVSGE